MHLEHPLRWGDHFVQGELGKNHILAMIYNAVSVVNFAHAPFASSYNKPVCQIHYYHIMLDNWPDMIYWLFWLQGLFKPKQNMAVERNCTFRIVLIICNSEHCRCGNYVQWICISVEWYSSKPPQMITALHVLHATAAYHLSMSTQCNFTMTNLSSSGYHKHGDPWEKFSVFQSARNQTFAATSQVSNLVTHLTSPRGLLLNENMSRNPHIDLLANKFAIWINRNVFCALIF